MITQTQRSDARSLRGRALVRSTSMETTELGGCQPWYERGANYAPEQLPCGPKSVFAFAHVPRKSRTG
jgi:hypothetical protein